MSPSEYQAHASSCAHFDRTGPTPVIQADACPDSDAADADFVASWAVANKLPRPARLPSRMHVATYLAQYTTEGLRS